MSHRVLLPWESVPRSVALRIAALNAKRIVEGVHQPGDLLTEAALAGDLRASRTPAREAMLQLQAWGLVRLIPKKGAIVTSVSASERRDLSDLRATWEIRAVERLIEDPESRTRLVNGLRSIIEAQQAAVDHADALDFAAQDCAFHLRIIDAGGNRVVAEQLDLLGPRFSRLIYQVISDNPPAAAVLRQEHERLCDLVAVGDAAGFAIAIRAHITDNHFPPETR